MAKKIVTDLQVEGKKVLVRVDFNVPLKDGVITDDNRIVQALPTIKYLIDHNAKVILFSHLGKVKSEEDKAKLSLRPVAERLSELLGKPVTFVPETRGEKLEAAINALKEGDVLFGLSTSGNSKNILNAIEAAKAKGMKVIAMTGKDGGKMAEQGQSGAGHGNPGTGCGPGQTGCFLCAGSGNACRVYRPGGGHGPGQIRPGGPQDSRHLQQHRDARLLSASGGRSPRGSRHDPQGRHGAGHLQFRRN